MQIEVVMEIYSFEGSDKLPPAHFPVKKIFVFNRESYALI